MPPYSGSSVDDEEIARFDALAAGWWQPDGAMAPLHRLNPCRLSYLRDRLTAHFDLDPDARHPFHGLRILDVGCGGGLLSEPLARLGADVVGIDAAAEAIEAARAHAGQGGLGIDYRCGTAEELLGSGAQFDVVIASEIVEHVADAPSFIQSCGKLTRPGGAFALSTINRTAKSFLFAKVAAEYVLHWLPRGTHQWQRFLTPAELTAHMEAAGLTVLDRRGMIYDLLRDEWRLGASLDVNFWLFGARR